MVQALSGLSGLSALSALGLTILSRFTAADNTALTAYTPDKGGAWTAVTGTFKVSSNTIIPNSNADSDISTCTGLADGTLECTLTPFDNGSTTASIPGLVFRYVDTTHFWLLQLDSRQNLVQLYENNAGLTLRWQYTLTIDSATAYAVKIILRGNTITVLVNGANEFTYVSSFNATATKIGIRLGKTSTPATPCSWDTFKMSKTGTGSRVWPLFTKDAGNPVLSVGAAGTWEDVDISNPDVFFDTPNNRWVMTYSGWDGATWGTGFATATSLDGPWTKYASNPILLPDGAAESTYIAANGSTVYLGGTYYHYYQTGATPVIRCMTATAMEGPWTRRGVVLSGSVGQWDATAVFDPVVRFAADGTTIQLFYCGTNGTRQIGWATSTNGLIFTKQGVLFTNPATASVNSNLGEPYVIGTSPLLLVTYDEATVSGARFIGMNVSQDGGATWHVRHGALLKGTGWESAQVFDSCLVQIGATLHLFYAGATTTGVAENLTANIGHASVAWSL